MMIDVKVSNPVPKIKAILKSMFSGDLKGLVTNAKNAIPPFQLTMSGAVTIVVALGKESSPWEFEMSPGSAGFTLGYGMNSDTNGFSDGVYAAANFNMCVTDMVSPLAHGFFKCGGRAIFQNICQSARVAMYLNPSNGFGLAAEFSAQIVDAYQADISMSVNMEKIELAAALQININGAKANMGAAVGFLYSNVPVRPYITVTPDIGAILSALGGMAGRVVGDLGRTVKGWFGFEEAEILLFEKQEAERAAHKRSNMQTTRAKPADMGRRLLMKAEALKEGIDEEALSKTMHDSVYLDTGDSARSRRRRRWHRHHWHDSHHRHHFHHRHRPHVHIPPTHWTMSDIGSVRLQFSEASVQADMCGFHLTFKVTASCTIFGSTASGSFRINIRLDLGDMVNKIINEIKSGFNTLKNGWTSVFEETQLQMRQRSQFSFGKKTKGA